MAPVKKIRKMAAVDLGALLDAGDGAVVTPVAGDTRLAAHRAVLAARSPVFEAMFRHDTMEASSGEVAIPDVEGPVLRQLLAYMYTLQAPQEPSRVAQLLSAADKYGLLGLKAECEQRLATELTVESAAAAAVLAVRHSCPTLSRLVAEPPADIRNLHVEEKGKRLIEAAREGTMELRTLLAAGADVYARAEDERTALHGAADGGHVDAARCLVGSGADVDARTTDQHTPLHLAAWQGHTAMVQLLVEASADCNAKDHKGRTPLHWAALNDHRDTVAALLEVGAEKGAKDDNGKTPLMLATEENHLEVIEILN